MKSAQTPVLEFENWEIVQSFLPEGWAEQARIMGAMQRARYISEPDVVLRVLLLHLACGCSLAETAARASSSGLASISSVGVFKRLRAAEPWLRWLANAMRGGTSAVLGVVGRRVRAVDGTAVSEPGSTGTDWRIHYAVDLADLGCDFFLLTDVHRGGETFRRVPVKAGDLMIGDRVYASPPGILHVLRAHGDVIVRLNRQALPLFDRHGKRLRLLPLLRRLVGAAPREYAAYIRNSKDGSFVRGRLIALRQSVEVTQASQRRLARRAQRKQETVSEASLEFAGYFMLWTSLPATVPGSQVLELYRLRWQIELVFKRMKSILGLGHLPKKDFVSARAWLEGKLFVGLLIERMIQTADSFSPWGYRLAGATQPLEGN